MDKSWMGSQRNRQPYMRGVEEFLEYAVSNFKLSNNIDPLEIPCPCIKCVNHLPHSVQLVRDHLITHGINETYTNWTYHGEQYDPPLPYIVDDDFDMDTSYVVDSMDDTTEKPTDAAENEELVQAAEELFMDDPTKFREMLEDAEKPLYEGCPNFTKLSAIIQLLNLKKGNEMYSGTYEAKKAFKQLGSGYEKIHACVNRCILYRNEYENLTECPNCGKSRWKVDEQKNKIYENVPANVMWYFPIIPRMKRLKVEPGVMRHPADSPAWAAIDDKFPEFGSERRNLRLGISADGVDVNSGTRHHSVWPVLAVIYNLPPWLCMKRKFIMLSLLISGSPGQDIDVFLAPLVDDLQIVFDRGVETYDAYAQEKFILRAAVLWTINDYPALGTLCGSPHSGFRGCVVCGEQTHCIRVPESNKQCYAGHRRYLPYDHPFRKQKKAFNGEQEPLLALEPLTGEEIYNKNVAESIIGTLLDVPNKTKDGHKARLDLVHFNLKPELHPKKEGNKTTLPPAACTLMKEEKDKFCQSLYHLKVPQGYCSNFSNLVSLKDMKLIGLKSHDYHMLMQEFLPCMKHAPTRIAITRNRPEGCIAEEIVAEETIEFFTEFLRKMDTTALLYRLQKRDKLVQSSLRKHISLCCKIHLKLNRTSRDTCNFCKTNTLLNNKNISSKSTVKRLVYRDSQVRKDSVTATVDWLSHKPNINVLKYDVYVINGYTFRTKSRECKGYQDSGVSVVATDTHISKDVVTHVKNTYYGVLQEIWVLYYNFKRIPIFKCDWVDSRNGVKKDKLGYTLVELKRLGHKDDPFILASQSKQVFYVADPLDQKKSIVFNSPPKNYRDAYDDVDEEFSTIGIVIRKEKAVKELGVIWSLWQPAARPFKKASPINNSVTIRLCLFALLSSSRSAVQEQEPYRDTSLLIRCSAAPLLCCSSASLLLRFSACDRLTVRLRKKTLFWLDSALKFLVDMDFKVGQPIEIIADGSGFNASYYTGTVVQVYEDYNERVAVRYDKVKDYNGNPLVDDLPKEDLRPVAPKVDVNLETNNIVNAWDGEGWWNGKLIHPAGNLYTVDLGSESDPKIEVFRKKHLRINQRWQMLEHGQHRWVYVKNQNVDFLVGSRVEIVGFEAGMTNSYYAGIVVGYSRNARVQVKYETLTSNGHARIDDFTRSDIRPYPAYVNINIGVGDIVDVWENHGWWMGKCTAVNTRTDEYTVVKEN
ncbi:hypothetical protein LXL04_039589 [Taraxacum kok-saghyz]